MEVILQSAEQKLQRTPARRISRTNSGKIDKAAISKILERSMLENVEVIAQKPEVDEKSELMERIELDDICGNKKRGSRTSSKVNSRISTPKGTPKSSPASSRAPSRNVSPASSRAPSCPGSKASSGTSTPRNGGVNSSPGIEMLSELGTLLKGVDAEVRNYQHNLEEWYQDETPRSTSPPQQPKFNLQIPKLGAADLVPTSAFGWRTEELWCKCEEIPTTEEVSEEQYQQQFQLHLRPQFRLGTSALHRVTPLIEMGWVLPAVAKLQDDGAELPLDKLEIRVL